MEEVLTLCLLSSRCCCCLLCRYLPFWDQFSHSMRLWSPCSSAFCFSSRGRPSGGWGWRHGLGGWAALGGLQCTAAPASAFSPRLPAHSPACLLAVSEVCAQAHISVQAVPRPDQAAAAAAAALPDGDGLEPPHPFYHSLLIAEAQLPVWLAPGSMASWSWQ